MLNVLRRRRSVPLPDGADPLRIRNLLDDPRLRAVMGDTDGDDDGVVTPLKRIDRERRVTAGLFKTDRAA